MSNVCERGDSANSGLEIHFIRACIGIQLRMVFSKPVLLRPVWDLVKVSITFEKTTPWLAGSSLVKKLLSFCMLVLRVQSVSVLQNQGLASALLSRWDSGEWYGVMPVGMSCARVRSACVQLPWLTSSQRRFFRRLMDPGSS